MAQRVPTKTPTEEARVIGKKEFDSVLRKIKAEESKAAEAKSSMGGTIANAVEKYNLHPDALRLFRKYQKKSPASAAEFLLNLQTYFEYGDLGQIEDELPIETAAQRKAKLTKPDREAFEEEQAAARAERKARNGHDKPAGKLTKGSKVIKGGKLVDLHDTEHAGEA